MRFLREPLLHFLLLGAALFIIFFAWTSKPTARIVISPSQVEQLTKNFTAEWQRPPTAAELKDLVQDYILTEAYRREAVARGLDRDDPVIRDRLRMKMEFLAEGALHQADPTEAELQTYLQTHAADYRGDAHYTFTQIYLDPARHNDHLQRDAAELLARLKQPDAKADTIAGDPCLQERTFKNASTADVIRAFGDDFARALDRLPMNAWQGPITSSLGEHLVLLTTRIPGHEPTLAEVRDLVRKDLVEERRQAARVQFEHDMLQRYPAEIHWPPPATQASTPAATGPAATGGAR